MLKPTAVAFAILLAGCGASAQTRSPGIGQTLAATCSNCHPTASDGAGDVPSLAGVPKDDIVRAMKAFKAGTRPATVMQQLARGYTDEQIDALAGWFAAQRRTN